MTLIEQNSLQQNLDETEATQELARLVEEAKNRPQPAVNDDAPPPAPPMQDLRTPAQRKNDFMRDYAQLVNRDRCFLVPTQRWLPGQQPTMDIEPMTFEINNKSEPPKKGKQH